MPSPNAREQRHLAPVVDPTMTTVNIDQVLDEWTAWMSASHCSPETIKLRRWNIRHILDGVRMLDDPWAVTTQQLVDFIARQPWKPATARGYRASLRSFYGWARDVGYITVSPAHALPRVKMPRSRPRPIPEEDYAVTTLMVRDDVLLAVLLGGNCGMRRGEIARTAREDLERDLLGEWWLRVVGKGGHERLVPVPDELASLIRARPAGWLFPSPSPRRRGLHVTPGHIGKTISAALPGSWTTHSLRHRCATVALDETRDLRAVQELLGHASVATTQLYTLVTDSRIRAAVNAANLQRQAAA